MKIEWANNLRLNVQFKLLLKDLRPRDLRNLYLRAATKPLPMRKRPRVSRSRSTNRSRRKRNKVTNLRIFGAIVRRKDL